MRGRPPQLLLARSPKDTLLAIGLAEHQAVTILLISQ